MIASNLISSVKLLFVKDKELYVFIHGITGYYPRRIALYQLALVHRSNPVQLPDGRWANNERLEYLGDAVLDAVVAHYLYRVFPSKHEGFLTSARAKIVKRESLNRIGNILHIDAHVRSSQHSSSHNSYICGNALEALVGACYLDQGYERCQRFIEERIIKANFNTRDLVRNELNHKSKLIEWAQKYHVAIEYELVDTYADRDNNPIFKTAVTLGGIYAGEGIGYSKKESHQAASKQALDRLASEANFKRRVIATGSEAAGSVD